MFIPCLNLKLKWLKEESTYQGADYASLLYHQLV